MNRTEIITKVKEYFSASEFVDKTVYSKYGDNAFKFIDTDLLHCILIVREELGKPMTINNWKSGGKFSQRGLRTNISNIVKKKSDAYKLYLSAHLFGKAVDFDVKGMDAEEVRMWIKDNAQLFPCKVRLEHNMKGTPINWVHLDTIDEDKNPSVYLFNV
jgi:hypothetical protein